MVLQSLPLVQPSPSDPALSNSFCSSSPKFPVQFCVTRMFVTLFSMLRSLYYTEYNFQMYWEILVFTRHIPKFVRSGTLWRTNLWQSTALVSDILRHFFSPRTSISQLKWLSSWLSLSHPGKNCDSTWLSLVVLGITVMGPFQKHCGVLHNSANQYESDKKYQHSQRNGIFILSTAPTSQSFIFHVHVIPYQLSLILYRLQCS